ncbi:MAG TPA: ATP-binding protein [Candidatus Binatia bacterium]
MAQTQKTQSDESALSAQGLRRRLLVLVLIAIVPAMGLILYNTAEERSLRISAIREDAQRIVQIASVRYGRLLDSSRQLLTVLAEVPTVRGSDRRCSEVLKKVLDRYGYYANIGVILPDGTVSCSAVKLPGTTNVADRSYFRRAMETKSFAMGDYQIGRITGRASIVFGLPLLDAEENVEGVLFAALDLNWLDSLAAEIEISPGATLSVFDRQGTVLANFPDAEVWVGKNVSTEPIFRLLQVQHRGVEEITGIDREQRLYAFTVLGGNATAGRAYIAVGIPKGSADSQAQEALLLNLFWLVVVGLLAVAVPWFLGRQFIVKYVEERARAEEARLKLAAIVESSEDAIIGNNLDGTITTWNSGAERIYGYTAEDVLGSSLTLLNPPDRPNEMPQIIEIVRQGKGLNRYETERITKDGRRLCISASVSPIRDHHGEVVGVSSIARDVTAIKKVEEKLRTHATQMETLYRVAHEVGGTLAVDEVINRALNRIVPASGFDFALIHFADGESDGKIYGVDGRSIAAREPGPWLKQLGSTFTKTVSACKEPCLVENAESDPELRRVFEVAGVRGLAILPLVTNEQFQGTLTLMSPRVHPFLPEESQFLPALAQQIGLALANASLFSETVSMNEHLHKEVEVRRQAEKALADFTAMVVHDLRSPLSNLLSIMESMRHELFGAVTEQQVKWLRKMENNCVSLIDHISDFLDLSKIEAGHVELVTKQVNLATLIYENLVEHSIQADKRNIRLNMEVENDLPAITLDPRRLNQVLGNLLSNALKFTGEGGQVEVGARRGDVAEEVIVWVRDTGVGISRHELAEIFDVYKQVSSGKNTHHSGTGLGLAICKKIVEAHGGRIWVESEEGNGTVFIFSLPLKPPVDAELSGQESLRL